MEKNATKFEQAYNLDCSKQIEKKKTGGTELSYLSWPYAWANFKTIYPDATYRIIKFNDLPYKVDPETGIIVFTEVTADGQTYEMWLPVMDGSNKAMKLVSYTYPVKMKGGTFEDRVVKAADMFDINKTIMRCLTKNLAMFGVGLSIYAGEDIPIPLTDDENAAMLAKMTDDKAKTQKRRSTVVETKENAPAPAQPQTATPSVVTITNDMYLNGRCKSIIAFLADNYDAETNTIKDEAIQRIDSKYQWAEGVRATVLNAAMNDGFLKDLHN